ncbi:hypothetical protein LJC49_09655 [Ruminococcaceae bacterium OttesenSCG-928-I18]|nr:hypothetical protein [Ruminococcaceae bacterium OttesenSCG-928-I18]
MNRIREALQAGEAIHCENEDEARRLFAAMGWNPYLNSRDGISRFCYPHYFWTESNEKEWNGSDVKCLCHEIVPFSTLTRSRLAECLGVEDGEAFYWRGTKYRVEDNEVMSGAFVEQKAVVVYNMIAHPEKIVTFPVWSEDEKGWARGAEMLGLKYVAKDGSDRRVFLYGDKPVFDETRSGWVPCPDNEDIRALYMPEDWPNIQPGQTIALSEIK